MAWFSKLVGDLGSRKLFFNKYFLFLAAFTIWLTFFDHFSLLTQYKLNKTVTALQEEKTKYEELLKESIEQKETIFSNKEKYAREEYIFHKENEEVIYIPTQKNSTNK